MPANLENSGLATGLGKISFHSNPKERQCQRMLKLPHIALISHASQVMLKILQARLQQYVNRELPAVQAGFIKGRGKRDQIANTRWIMAKAREFQKSIYFCFIDYAKAFDCVSEWVKSLSRVRLFVTPWTVAHQAPPSMDSPSKNTGVGCHFLLQFDSADHSKLWKILQEMGIPHHPTCLLRNLYAG